MRHFFVDRVIELEKGVRAAGVKAVALSDDAFDAHFPGNPVLPGVHLLEGLAQTAGVLLARSTEGRRLALMASIERARFLAFARPGDLVRLEVEIESLDEAAARVMGAARRGPAVIASARFLFRLVEPDRVIAPAYRPVWEAALSTWCGDYLDPADG